MQYSPHIILKNMIVSFDFDGTLCWVNKKDISIFRRNIKVFNIFKKHQEQKDTLIIVTFRNIKNETEEMKIKENRVLLLEFLDKFNLKVNNIIYTNHKPKKPYLLKNKVSIHYDDCFETIKSLEGTAIKGVLIKKKIKC